MSSGRSWLETLFSKDKRNAKRCEAPRLVAYFWQGGTPTSHPVRDISSTGFYLLTEERWSPGTMILLTLQETDTEKTADDSHIMVQSRVVRQGDDGIAFEFVPHHDAGRGQENFSRNGGAGRKALARFLNNCLKSVQHLMALLPLLSRSRLGRQIHQNLGSERSGGNMMMKILRDESGQSMIISALCLTCLLGFAGFAVDAGIMLEQRRLAQTAADSAAIAAALELNYGDATAAGRAASAQNGFTHGANGVTVTINEPPSYGPHASATANGYAEAIISQSTPTYFMNFFGLSAMTVTARAVAGNVGSSYGCVYVLAPTGSQTMELQGSFDVTAPNCGVIVDSNDSDALDFTGGGGTLTAGSVGVVGGCGGKCSDSTPTPVTGIVAQSDPLNYITPPDPTKLTCTTPSGGTLTGTVGPAVAGGTACYNGNVTLNNVTLNPGTYVFTGNVTLSGTVTSATSTTPFGTTLDINSGSLSVSTGSTLAIVAPTTGTLNGIALMQPLANTNEMQLQFGSSSGSITGIIYAPGAELYLQDSGGDKSGGVSLTTNLIVNSLYDKTATLSIASYSQSVSTSPLTRVGLVE